MFSLKEKLKFLEDGVDFPFYNDNPKLSSIEWLMILLAVIIFVSILYVFDIPDPYKEILLFLILTVPALYICKGNYGLFFKKLRLKDIPTIIFCFVGYYLYVGLIIGLLSIMKYPMKGNAAISTFTNPTLMSYVFMALQLVGEEFLKIFVLLLIMYAIYKLTNNRNLSLGIGFVGTLLFFGGLHYSAYGGRLLQVLLIQGIGSIFDLYAYTKTKNVVVSYIVHFLIDLTVFIIVPLKSHLMINFF